MPNQEGAELVYQSGMDKLRKNTPNLELYSRAEYAGI